MRQIGIASSDILSVLMIILYNHIGLNHCASVIRGSSPLSPAREAILLSFEQLLSHKPELKRQG